MWSMIATAVSLSLTHMIQINSRPVGSHWERLLQMSHCAVVVGYALQYCRRSYLQLLQGFVVEPRLLLHLLRIILKPGVGVAAVVVAALSTLRLPTSNAAVTSVRALLNKIRMSSRHTGNSARGTGSQSRSAPPFSHNPVVHPPSVTITYCTPLQP